jgi:hypothetical protein
MVMRVSMSWFAAVACAVGIAPIVASAQNNASASVTAVVQQPIAVTKDADLVFGDVFPGLSKTIDVTDAGAAEFEIAGQASANVNLTFTLPTTLTSGGNSLTVTSWTGIYNTTNSASSGTTFTPSTSATSSTLSGTGALFVFVGATVSPPVTQAAGTYTGTLTLTVVYF